MPESDAGSVRQPPPQLLLVTYNASLQLLVTYNASLQLVVTYNASLQLLVTYNGSLQPYLPANPTSGCHINPQTPLLLSYNVNHQPIFLTTKPHFCTSDTPIPTSSFPICSANLQSSFLLIVPTPVPRKPPLLVTLSYVYPQI